METQTTAPTPAAPAADQYTKVSAEWPGAFQLYKYAKSATLVNWRPYLALVVLSIVLAAIPNQFAKNESLSALTIILSLVSLAVSVYLSIALVIVELKDVAREKISFGESLSQSGQYFVSMFVATILAGLLIALSIILLFIPFFFVRPRLALFQYHLVDKNLGPLDAIKASWENTRGHSSKVWGIIGVSILFALITITIIGIPVALYLIFMYGTALTLLYRWIENGRSAAKPASPIEANL